jgi:hypothetical protein
MAIEFNPKIPLVNVSQLQGLSGKGSLASTVLTSDSFVFPKSTIVRLQNYEANFFGIKLAFIQADEIVSRWRSPTVTKLGSTTGLRAVRKQESYKITFEGKGKAAVVAVFENEKDVLTVAELQMLTNASNVIVLESYSAGEESTPEVVTVNLASELLKSLSKGRKKTRPENTLNNIEKNNIFALANDRANASYGTLFIASYTKDTHLTEEVNSLLTWLSSFSNSGEVVDQLVSYRNAVQPTLESLAQQQTLRGHMSANGNSFSKSSAEKHEEARSFRFNSGTSIDFYSPLVYTQCEDFTLQGRNLFLLTDLQKRTSQYSWDRVSTLSVLNTKTQVTVATTSSYLYTKTCYRVSERLVEDCKTLKLQATEGIDVIAGKLNAQYNGDFTTRSEGQFLSSSKGDSYLLSGGNVCLAAKDEVQSISDSDTNVLAKRNLFLTGSINTYLSGSAGVHISGSVVYLGSGGSVIKPVLDLDVGKILGDKSQLSELGVVSADGPVTVTAGGLSLASNRVAEIVSNAIQEGAPDLLKDWTQGKQSDSLGSVLQNALKGLTDDRNVTALGALIGRALRGNSVDDLLKDAERQISTASIKELQKVATKELRKLFRGKKKAELPPVPEREEIPELPQINDLEKL